MKKTKVSILLCSILLLLAGPAWAKRKPLLRPILKKIEHQPTGKRLRFNLKTKQYEEYKVEGKITYERLSGNFFLSWNGPNGKRQIIVYQPRDQLDAVIAAAVSYDPEQNLYHYSYGVSNLSSSKQKLKMFYVETRAPSRNVKIPDGTWFSDTLTSYLKEQFKIEDGFFWAQALNGKTGLNPGERTGGFSYVSEGIPTVVNCYVYPDVELTGDSGENLPEELHAAIDRVAWKIPHGVAVGPTRPPPTIEPAVFLKNVQKMVDTSLRQGWIESPGVAGELKSSLAQLAFAIKNKNQARSSRILGFLLQRVEKEKDRTLLSEAYALVKFNLEYLQNQMQATSGLWLNSSKARKIKADK